MNDKSTGERQIKIYWKLFQLQMCKVKLPSQRLPLLPPAANVSSYNRAGWWSYQSIRFIFGIQNEKCMGYRINKTARKSAVNFMSNGCVNWKMRFPPFCSLRFELCSSMEHSLLTLAQIWDNTTDREFNGLSNAFFRFTLAMILFEIMRNNWSNIPKCQFWPYLTSFDLEVVDLRSPKLHTIKFLGDSSCVPSLVILPFIGAEIIGGWGQNPPRPPSTAWYS